MVTDDSLVAIRLADGSFTRADSGTRPLYSITKTYIAATIAALGIDTDRRVSDWLGPDWVPRGGDISVHQLLTHTSGLADYGALPAYGHAVAAGEPVWSDDEFADHTLRRPLLFEPGEGWSYSNPGYWVLGRIAEREADADLGQVIERCVTGPLALSSTRVSTGVFAPDLPGYPAGWVWHGLLVGTAADSATFMASPLAAQLARHPVPVPGTHAGWHAPHYGLGVMVEPGERYGHNGGGPGYSASCFHFQKDGTTLCVLMRSEAEDAAMNHLLALRAHEGPAPT